MTTKQTIDLEGMKAFRSTGSDGTRLRRWRIKLSGELTSQSTYYARRRCERLASRLFGNGE